MKNKLYEYTLKIYDYTLKIYDYTLKIYEYTLKIYEYTLKIYDYTLKIYDYTLKIGGWCIGMEGVHVCIISNIYKWGKLNGSIYRQPCLKISVSLWIIDVWEKDLLSSSFIYYVL